MFNKNYKRLPDNPNVKMHWGKSYNEYELLPNVGPFIEQSLAKIDQSIEWALEKSSKLYAVRLDLRFPRHYELSGLGDFSNDHINNFFKSLIARLDRYCKNRPHWHHLIGLWSREYDKDQSRPHFHVALLLNGQVFRSLGGARGESLYRMVEEAWLSAIRCRGFGYDRLVHKCENGQYWIDKADPDGPRSLFRRMSYMAKIEDKDFSDGYRRFGLRMARHIKR